MTHFDELLRKAFDAGVKRGDALASRAEGYHVPGIPTFEEWRATLSGLDTREGVGPIEVGDTVRILPSWGSTFKQFHGRFGEVYHAMAGSVIIYVNVRERGGTLSLAIPRQHVEKAPF